MVQEQEQQEIVEAHRALLKARAVQDRASEAELLMRLGRLYDGIGLTADSLEYAMEGLRLGEQLDDGELVVEQLNNIACIYMGRHEWDAAEDYLQRAGHYLSRFDYPEARRRVRSNHISVLIERGQYALAQPLLDELEHDSRQAGDTRRLLRCSLLQGWLARLEGRWSEALSRLEAARAESLAQDRHDVWVYVLDELSLLYSMPESPCYDPAQAEVYLQEGLAWIESVQYVDAVQDIRRSLVTLYRQQRRFEEALIQFEHLHEQEKRRFSETSERRFQLLQVREETERHRHQAELERLRNDELAEALDEARQLRHEAEEAARHDSLTGLFNRRYLDEQLVALYRRARQSGSPLGVAIADIDHFKHVNDGWSHATGDMVLRIVAMILSQELRASDILGRYGGEEFVLLLPDTDTSSAESICERLRQAVSGYDWGVVAPDLAVTISLGLYCASAAPETLLAEADAQLYRAKSEGRNRVCAMLSQ